MWRLIVIVMVMLVAVTAHADHDDSKPVTYAVDGELGIHVDVTYMTMTGTTHAATHLEIHAGKVMLTRDELPEDGMPQVPLMQKAIAIAPKRWLLIGWSSTGGGMATMAAWIVAASGKNLRVTDELYWTSDRMHNGFAIEDDKGKLRIGIPEAPSEGAHNRGDWELHIGKKAVAFEKLKYAMATSKLFAPPMEEARDLTTKIAWITASGAKFVAN